MFFASDNTSGVPEQILTALSRANDGFAMGYGGDALMEQVRDKLRAVFEAFGPRRSYWGSSSVLPIRGLAPCV